MFHRAWKKYVRTLARGLLPCGKFLLAVNRSLLQAHFAFASYSRPGKPLHQVPMRNCWGHKLPWRYKEMLIKIVKFWIRFFVKWWSEQYDSMCNCWGHKLPWGYKEMLIKIVKFRIHFFVKWWAGWAVSKIFSYPLNTKLSTESPKTKIVKIKLIFLNSFTIYLFSNGFHSCVTAVSIIQDLSFTN